MKKIMFSILVAFTVLASVPTFAHDPNGYQPSGYAIAESQNPARYVDKTGRPYYTCPRAECYNQALSYNPYYQYHNRYIPRIPPKIWYGPPVYGHTHGPYCGHSVRVYYNNSNFGIGINYSDGNFGVGFQYEDWNH